MRWGTALPAAPPLPVLVLVADAVEVTVLIPEEDAVLEKDMLAVEVLVVDTEEVAVDVAVVLKHDENAPAWYASRASFSTATVVAHTASSKAAIAFACWHTRRLLVRYASSAVQLDTMADNVWAVASHVVPPLSGTGVLRTLLAPGTKSVQERPALFPGHTASIELSPLL